MPYSNVEQITPIMTELLRIRPRKLIDVGCGLGVYGILSRIQLDLYFDENFYKKLFRKIRPEKIRWETTIDAIEGFEDYLDYIPDWVYDNIIVEDARTALSKIPDNNYNLALALAVIEHLSREEGIEFINNLKRISHCIIMSVPKNVAPQFVPDNDFETHRSKWSKEDFINLGFHKFLSHEYAWIPVYDPSLPAYSENFDNQISFNQKSVCMTDTESNLALKMDIISENIKQLTKLQTVVLDRLSVKHRIKSILRRFGLNR